MTFGSAEKSLRSRRIWLWLTLLFLVLPTGMFFLGAFIFFRAMNVSSASIYGYYSLALLAASIWMLADKWQSLRILFGATAIVTVGMGLYLQGAKFYKDTFTPVFGISNYEPSNFVESAEFPFFYSIGKHLKYGSKIDESAPDLFEGSWLNGDLLKVYPSPDNQAVAIVSNRKLYIAKVGRVPFLALENVDHYAPKKLSEGDIYFKWPTLQWHPNSRFIYIAKDKKQKIISEQLFSKDATLVRIDIENINAITELVAEFRSSDYFFVGSDNVCFNYESDNGSIIWKCSTANGISPARSLDSSGIHLDNGVVLTERPFLSYEPDIYETAVWMARYGFSVRRLNEGQDGLFHKDAPKTPLLVFNTTIDQMKGGSVNGIRQSGGSVLPGGRYLLLDVSEGQILLDRVSRLYRKLPKDTKVHRNLNSTHYKDFVFSLDNRLGDSFKPDTKVLP